MKKLYFPLIVLVLAQTLTFAQNKGSYEPGKVNFASPGFISINEITAGFGLGDKSTPASKYIWGVTSVNGYNIDRNFLVGGGTGVYLYNDDVHIPLFVDVRFTLENSDTSPYIWADGGYMFDLETIEESMLFINGGAGMRIRLNDVLAANIGGGLFIQQGGSYGRDSFLNLKVGIQYKPMK